MRVCESRLLYKWLPSCKPSFHIRHSGWFSGGDGRHGELARKRLVERPWTLVLDLSVDLCDRSVIGFTRGYKRRSP